MGLYRKPDGSIVSVPDEEASGVIASGYVPVTPSEAAPTATATTPEDRGWVGTLNAGATGLLSGATLGVSDWALSGLLNKGQRERLAYERESNPVASGIGQIAGMVLPGLAAPESLLGKAPSGYLSHATADAAASYAADGGVAGTLGQIGAMGVEGAVQNAGAYLGDTALGDRDLTAEGMAGALGSGFAFGSGGGAAALGIERGTIAARRMFARVAEGGDKALTLAQQEWQQRLMSTVDAHDAAADIARAKVAAAQAERQAAALARDQAAAGVLDARIAAPEVDAAHLRAQALDEKIGAVQANEAAVPEFTGPVGGIDDLAKLVEAHDAARSELETMLNRIDAPEIQAEIPGATVPVGEFGAPGAPGIRRGADIVPRPPTAVEAATGDVTVAGKRKLADGTPAPVSLGEVASGDLAPVPSSLPEPVGGFRPVAREAGGSQGGKWLEDGAGQQWFAKTYNGNTDRVEGEHLANELYRMFGVDVPETKIADVGGKRTLLSKEVIGRAAKNGADVAATNAADGFAVDAWLANWDVVGTGHDNILIGEGGKAHRIDNGGSTIWRAQGEPKPFTTPVAELETMRNPKLPSGEVFGGLSKEQIDEQLHNFAQHYEANKGAIDSVVDSSGLSPSAKESIKAGLHDRATWMIAQVKPQPGALSPEEFSALADDAVAKMSPESLDAVKAWTGNGMYGPINTRFRETQGKPGLGGLRAIEKNYHPTIDAIDEAMKANPAPRDMTLYRGVSHENAVKQLGALKAGDTFVDPGFGSTSFQRSIGKDFSEGYGVRKGIELHISVPKGYPMLALSSASSAFDREAEVLLSRNARYVVTGVETAEDGHKIMNVALRKADEAAPRPIPPGFTIDGVDHEGRPLFTGTPDIVFGVPKFSDLSPATFREVGFSVRPSELAEAGVAGKPVPAGEITDAMKPLEIKAHRNGGYSIASDGGLDRLMAAAQDGDRPVLVRFWPSQVAKPESAENLAGEIRSAISKDGPGPAAEQTMSLGRAAESGAAKPAIPLPSEIAASGDALVTTVPASVINDHGWYEMPGQGADVVKMDKARKAIAEGQRDAVRIGVADDGRLIVEDGRHRLSAAVEADKPIKVEWFHAAGIGPSDIARGGAEKAVLGSPEWHKYLADNIGKAWKSEGSYAAGFAKLEREFAETGKSSLMPAQGPAHPAVKFTTTSDAAATGTRAMHVIEASVNGKGAGVIRIAVDANGDYYVGNVVVLPEFRRTGIGTQLYDEANRMAGQAGVALKSGTTTSEKAAALWRKLVSEGKAVETSAGKYKMLPYSGELEAALRGTAGKLEGGADLKAMGAPARAEYAAAKAERTKAAAAHFRAKANERNYAASQMGADERAMQAAQMHPLASKQLELAHDAAIERAATATDPAIKRAAIEEASAIERQLTAVGARPGVVEDVAAVAPTMTKYEEASANLTEALGPEAPPAAQEAAKAYREAEAAADRKVMDRTARAVDDHVDSLPKVGPDRRPSAMGLTSQQRIDAAKAQKLSADARLAHARAAESEAKIGAQAAKSSAKSARAALDAVQAPIPAAGGKLGALGSIATAVEVAGDLGVPGVPHPKDIPVIGPLLSTYLKFRAIKAAAGRFAGRVPATGTARAAALAAKTKDQIATAVDRSLGLVQQAASKGRDAFVATAVVLGRRVFDDGMPDAPKGASPQALAAVRIREIAAAATRPDAVAAMVRRELASVSDPDLIAAAEKHLIARFQYLNSVMPKAPPPNPYSQRKWEPSPAVTNDVAQRLAVANDPTAAFRALDRGALTPAMADTLRNTSPKLFALAQQRLIDRVGDLSNPVDYQNRLRASLLFDVALDPSLEPGGGAILKTAHDGGAAATPMTPPSQPQPPTPSIANPTNLTNLYQPTSDRRAQMR